MSTTGSGRHATRPGTGSSSARPPPARPRRRDVDPEAFREAHRRANRCYRARQVESGLTLHQLWLWVGGDREQLTWALRDEVRRGRVKFHSTSRRYVLNGGLDPDVCAALLGLTDSAAIMG